MSRTTKPSLSPIPLVTGDDGIEGDNGCTPAPRGLEVKMETGVALYVRPMEPADKALIAKAIRNMSDDARRMRFFHGFKEASRSLLNLLSDIDGDGHIAWGALDVSGPEEIPIAAVHAVNHHDKTETVDIACTVLDDYQGHGLARALLAAVCLECLAKGKITAIADVLSYNEKALHLFHGLGAELLSGGEVHTLKLDIKTMLHKLEQSGQPQFIPDLLTHIRDR